MFVSLFLIPSLFLNLPFLSLVNESIFSCSLFFFFFKYILNWLYLEIILQKHVPILHELLVVLRLYVWESMLFEGGRASHDVGF